MELRQQFVLSHLPKRPQINIEFQDLSYSVPIGRKGKKIIIRNVSGSIGSGKLTALLGPSGAGKSTLLNILAGYKCREATGVININGAPRNMQEFRKMSRYIMQNDLLQPLLTVHESMLVAANLKLSRELSQDKKLTAIEEILEMLRLSKSKNTTTNELSGGEKKRLSIALELVNNPPVIFLDEPTSGLDDLSSSQCVSLLKHLANGGRTVVCSIHSPSARLFEMFDHVYILAQGLCVYQGVGNEIVPFLRQIGVSCPLHYNPADFIIEVASGEYGEFIDKMILLTDNGKSYTNTETTQNEITNSQIVASKNPSKYDCSSWEQCKILLNRMLMQLFRNKTYLLLKMFLYIFLGLVIGCLFIGMGNDGSKTLFNFGFCFTCIIVFMYCSLLPVLLNFPTELQLIKRENFNRWYGLEAYFLAMTIINIPTQIIFGSVYLGIVYVLTDQPMEFQRILMFFTICILVALISENLGLAISSTLNILNGMFVGPTLTVPLMLLAVYGYGSGYETIPFIIRIAMSFSYLRYGMEGLTTAIYGNNRNFLPCPDEEIYCLYKYPIHLMNEMGMGHAEFWYDVVVLVGMYLLITVTSFYLLRQRLRPNKTFEYLHVIGRLIKSHVR